VVGPLGGRKKISSHIPALSVYTQSLEGKTEMTGRDRVWLGTKDKVRCLGRQSMHREMLIHQGATHFRTRFGQDAVIHSHTFTQVIQLMLVH